MCVIVVSWEASPGEREALLPGVSNENSDRYALETSFEVGGVALLLFCVG